MTNLPPRALVCELVFTGEGEALRDGVVIVASDGEILDVGLASEVLPRHQGARVETRKGLLLPGLVNAHTHLELSFLRGKAPGGAGFVPWVTGMLRARGQSSEEEIAAAIDDAVSELDRAGTVAVGDVTNSLAAVHALSRAKIGGAIFHELYGYDRERTLSQLAAFPADRDRIVGKWPTADLTYAPAPHTLYTLHPDVVKAIIATVRDLGTMTTLHLAEHPAERSFLERGDGPFVAFSEKVGSHAFPIPHRSPVEYAADLGALSPDVLAVHLTTATRPELDLVAKFGSPVVICPRSNLHIETRMPPLLDLLAAGIIPSLGTDSLSSTSTLDVLAEAKSLAERFASVPAHLLLRMATSAGADALRRPDLGRFKKGARPGVLHIDGGSSASADPLRHLLMRPPAQRSWAARRGIAA